MNVRKKTLIQACVGAAAGVLLARRGVGGRLRALAGAGPWFSPAMQVSIGLWVAFSLYWTVAAKDRAADKRGESRLSRQVHLWIVNIAQLMVILPVPGLRQRLLPDAVSLHAFGLSLQALSIVFAVWARRHLGANWSGEVRIAVEHRLVRSGPYGLVRHPIYTALLGMYLGTAIVSGELHALVALVLVLFAYRRKIGLEERALTEAFPDDHQRYRAETWAWIPGLY